MSKLIISGFIALCMFNIVAHADPVPPDSEAFRHKEGIGLGMGAVIGGLIAGPPGAIVGMAGGLWLGGNDQKKDETIAGLNEDLLNKDTNLVIMQGRFRDLQSSYGKELQQVAARNRLSSLQELSKSISLTVYFRTGSATINDDTGPRIEKLAAFLQQFPDIRLLVEGYADKRGTPDFNRKLGNQRARAVEAALLEAGIAPKRILTHSYGESRAQADESDIEGVIFDRRVNITLTTDTQI